ncbi:DNA repair protein RecN [hydrothermal vent metagenome]|uniref:DNA repair protein RecN n=1 Tax=hydrothermal vent metagenome TaxID=652676 RepID=A0A1W1C3P6_9ZZZZ
MLSSLHIQNLAIVEEQSIEFNQGLSVITGETGAGKSILLNALNLVLGERANSNLIKHNETRGSVIAEFEINQHKKILNWLKEQELDNQTDCLLRRTFTNDGKSKAFINSIPVNLNQLKSLGELLIDIHNQNEHYSLLKNSTQMALLDEYAKTTNLVSQINTIKQQYTELTQQISEIENNNQQQNEQKKLLTYYLQELEEAKLESEELNEIEVRYKSIKNYQTLIESISKISSQLDGDEGINDKLNHLVSEITQAQILDDKLSEAQKLINDAQLQAQEASYSLSQYLSSLENETDNENIEQRLNELHNLSNKHQTSIPKLLDKKYELEQQLNLLENSDEQVKILNNKLDKLILEYQTKANELSEIRKKSAIDFSLEVTELMQTLGMAGSVFKINLIKKELGIHLNGNEKISFDIQTNAGSKMQALNKIASGGELSRISLAIAVISAQFYSLPTVIFDEVDVGISGATAEIVGQKLQQLAKNTQVICITHLPQVAGFANQHLKVVKSTTQDNTRTQVINLNYNERIEEISRLVGGVNISDKTRLVAQELIKGEWQLKK